MKWNKVLRPQLLKSETNVVIQIVFSNLCQKKFEFLENDAECAIAQGFVQAAGVSYRTASMLMCGLLADPRVNNVTITDFYNWYVKIFLQLRKC